ncbi:MAG: hypothetical protein N3A01_06285 [Bacteroidales bacterium]|nr:hypothetical protein [Bacteroidales bacterium]
MKKLIILIALCWFFTFSKSQEMTIGKNFLNIGIGYPAHYWLSWYSSSTPAIKASIDHGYRIAGPGVVTLGGKLSLFQTWYKSFYYANFHKYNYSESYTHILMAFRGCYYYNLKEADIPEMNVYGGIALGLGYYLYSISYNGPGGDELPNRNSKAFPIMGIFVGTNYFITSKIAMFLEFGFDVTYASFGVTLNI